MTVGKTLNLPKENDNIFLRGQGGQGAVRV